jgi:hypothetical protein
MLKGAQKRMVVLRTATSSHFESAYFILKDDAPRDEGGQELSLLEEANRILDQSFAPPARGQRRERTFSRKQALLLFLFGFVIGALLGALVLLLLLHR